MTGTTGGFTIDDAEPFETNLCAFIASLTGDDVALAAVLKSELPRLLSGEINTATLWDALHKPDHAI